MENKITGKRPAGNPWKWGGNAVEINSIDILKVRNNNNNKRIYLTTVGLGLHASNNGHQLYGILK
jgi:hypothetical protein